MSSYVLLGLVVWVHEHDVGFVVVEEEVVVLELCSAERMDSGSTGKRGEAPGSIPVGSRSPLQGLEERGDNLSSGTNCHDLIG